MTATLAAARSALDDQALHPAPGDEFAEIVMATVGGAVPYDGYCLLGLDPTSGLRSFLFSRNGLDGVADRLTYNENVESDVNRYADLALAEVPVGILSTATRAEPLSPRLHEVLRPAGFTSELRLALRSGGRLWGALVLFRGDHRHPFTDADAARTVALADQLCTAVRRYPVRATDSTPDPLPPGVVLLDNANAIVSMTAEARAWVEDLRAGGLDEIEFEDALRVVYDVGLATQRMSETGLAPVCRVRTATGRWLVVQGAPVLDCAPAVVAVVLQPAALRQVLPAAAAWFGLTRRETEVLDLVARGMAAKHMGRRLELSVLTINDHLRSAYRKAGVSGREELLARLT